MPPFHKLQLNFVADLCNLAAGLRFHLTPFTR